MLIREYDECEGWAQPGLRSCAHWLNWKCSINIGTARVKVRVAHALKDLTKISEAFREGRLSYSKVRAMTRVATPANEDYLMMIAKHGTAAHVDRLVRLYRQVKRTEALEQENRRHEMRELTLYQDDDGSFVVHGRLTPEQGALLKKALDAGMDEDFEEQKSVPAGMFMPCLPLMPNQASKLPPRPRIPCGVASRWMINWQWRVCCIENNQAKSAREPTPVEKVP